MAATNPTTANLISWWKFDEASGNAADSHGTNTLTNNGTTGFATGLWSNCADLGTANSTKYFRRADVLGLTVNAARSYGCTFKMRTELSGADSIAKIFDNRHGSNKVQYTLGYARVSGVNKVFGGRTRINVADDSVYYNSNLGTAAWHQLIVTFNGTTQILYLDGAAVGNSNPNTGDGTGVFSDGFGIGASNVGDAYFTSAYVDESFAFNDVLTADEVTWLWNGLIGRPYSSFAGGGFMMFSC
jgi:hypothetical protein